jgi:E3 ubiquitin-protein ligase HECTD2
MHICITPYQVVYKKLKGRESVSLADLQDAHPDLYKGLTALLEYDEPSSSSDSSGSSSDGSCRPGSVEAVFGLTFEVAHEAYGAVHSVELCPGGASRVVTASNRQEYVDLYVKYLLDTSIRRQFDAFARGFHKVCCPIRFMRIYTYIIYIYI